MEISGIFAFMMAFALLESLAVTGFLVLLSVVLPSGWLKNGFAQKGLVSILVFAITSIIFQKFLDDFPPLPALLFALLMPIVVIVVFMLAVGSVPKIQSVLLSIQDRVLIMLFIYIPIGLLSLMVVVYQNLF